MLKRTETSSAAPHYVVSEEEKAAIAAAISQDELIRLALELGNIPSRSGHEAEAARYVYDWLEKEGFSPRKIAAVEHRPNIVGEYGGKGIGKNLLFTAHLDTESPDFTPELDGCKYRPETVSMREWKECWLENNRLHGFPLTNDRGPMSCFLIAAKALKTAGIELAGRLYLTACPGEIGPEPIEDKCGIDYLGKDIGAHYLFHHGHVAPDYAVAAEGTDFGITWVGSGYTLIRISLYGTTSFTPALDHPPAEQHPNPIYRAGRVIDALHAWGLDYQQRHRFDSAGGTALPNVQIDSVRAGVPHTFGAGTEICNLYLEAGLSPHQQVAPLLRELETLLHNCGAGEFRVEPLVVRHGAAADDDAVQPLHQAFAQATEQVCKQPLQIAHPVYSSMWRDHNVFNTQGIPAVTCGMPRSQPSPDDLLQSAMIYALTALSICGRATTDNED